MEGPKQKRNESKWQSSLLKCVQLRLLRKRKSTGVLMHGHDSREMCATGGGAAVLLNLNRQLWIVSQPKPLTTKRNLKGSRKMRSKLKPTGKSTKTTTSL